MIVKGAHRAGTRLPGSMKTQQRCFRKAARSKVAVASQSSTRTRSAGVLLAATVGVGALYTFGYPRSLHADTVPPPAEITFEKARKKASSRENNRDIISSQHLQVKKSWENPGVYSWGSNVGRVVAPDSEEAVIKTPRRISYFDGQLIRDIKLDKEFGAAISEGGDLLQWGNAFSTDSNGPTPTLRGKNLIKLEISKDRIIALSSSGTVYSVSATQTEQRTGPKPQEDSWFPFWTTRSPISYRKITIPNLNWGEKVVDVRSGQEHCLLLTSSGKLYSAASATTSFPSKGQLGVPGLTGNSQPTGSFDQPHEVSTLKGFEITKIAAGDYHSLAVDKQGRLFSFGDNSSGQLGFDLSQESPTIDAPSLVAIDKLYKGTNQIPTVTSIAAGGSNTFFTVDALRVAGQREVDPIGIGRITADTWASGQGITGSLGGGRWTHMQGTPTKIKALSGLFEYDETNNTTIPIRLSRISAGQTHVSAVMNNVTHVGANHNTSENDTNWGADALFWGGNEFYQLGTGKRNNQNTPLYIPPMDMQAEKNMGRREEHRFQITPRHKVKVGGRNVSVEQRIECGRGVTAVYSGT